MKKVLTIFGTRPEAIKLAPVVKRLDEHPEYFESIICATGQHDELVQQVLNLFEIKPDFDLMVMRKNQTLTELTLTILREIGEILSKIKPDIILIQGDTTSVFASALAAFYQRIKVGHIEAGLRTQDKCQPFPEEVNRCLTDQMSDFFFAPTEKNRRNLLAEGVPDEKIFVTGNTVVDALMEITSRADTFRNNVSPLYEGEMILITVHRRENFGNPLQNILKAIKRLALFHPQIQFIYPVHPNPNVQNAAFAVLSGLKNVRLLEPMDYFSFVYLMKNSYFILSDSGGVQEEAPSLNKPVIILRGKTERPELVEAGGAKLVGSDQELIFREVNKLIEDKDYYQRMVNIENPFGDGTAAEKIIEILKKSF